MSETYTKMAKDGDLASLAARISANETAIGNKADKTTTYTIENVNTLLSNLASGMFVVANALPQAGEAGKIYLVPNNGGESGNARDEYMWLNGAWELIGSKQVDLTNYYNKTDADGRFVQKQTGKGLSTNDYTDTDKEKVANALTAHQDISGKLDGAAAYPAWVAGTGYPEDSVVSHRGLLWIADIELPDTEPGTPEGDADWHSNGVTIDSMKQDALSSAQLSNIEDVPNKASFADLPYAMVTPGEWEFSGSGVQSGHVYSIVESYIEPSYAYDLYDNGTLISSYGTNERCDVGGIVEFDEYGAPSVAIVATRTGIHLLDRAVNAVSVSDATTLTLPSLVNAGKPRDFLVRLAISGSTVPTITFAAPTGETITYETDGDEFPVPDEAGTWLYSFTETAAHKFAVSLKKVQTVAQGGS